MATYLCPNPDCDRDSFEAPPLEVITVVDDPVIVVAPQCPEPGCDSEGRLVAGSP
jgi:hypothetical protein